MGNLNGFDANCVAAGTTLEPVPSGKYVAEIIDSELKATKSGVGRYLQLCLEIAAGPYSGHVLWVRLNLYNPSSSTVHLARKELAAICSAVGISRIDDSSELHRRKLVVCVRRCKRAGSDEFINRVIDYARIEPAAA